MSRDRVKMRKGKSKSVYRDEDDHDTTVLSGTAYIGVLRKWNKSFDLHARIHLLRNISCVYG